MFHELGTCGQLTQRALPLGRYKRARGSGRCSGRSTCPVCFDRARCRSRHVQYRRSPPGGRGRPQRGRYLYRQRSWHDQALGRAATGHDLLDHPPGGTLYASNAGSRGVSGYQDDCSGTLAALGTPPLTRARSMRSHRRRPLHPRPDRCQWHRRRLPRRHRRLTHPDQHVHRSRQHRRRKESPRAAWRSPATATPPRSPLYSRYRHRRDRGDRLHRADPAAFWRPPRPCRGPPAPGR